MLDLFGGSFQTVGVVDPLPLPPSHVVDRLKRAVDGLTMREVDPPPILLFGGNTGGLFESVRRGLLNESGVKVFSVDLSPLSVHGTAEGGVGGRVVLTAADAEVRDRVVSAMGAGADALGHGWFDFVLSLGALGQTLVARWRGTAAPLQSTNVVVETLDALRDAFPAVVVSIGDLADDQRRTVWDSVLTWSGTAKSYENRVLVLAGFDRRYDEDPMGGGPIDSDLLKLVKTGEEYNRVEWGWLGPLSDERIAQWLGGCDPSVLSALSALSGRDDLAAGKLWESWTEAGHVVQAGGAWTYGDKPEPFTRSLDELFRERLDDLRDPPWDVEQPRLVAEFALILAALGGPVFCRSAVAEVVSTSMGQAVSRDDVEQLLDLLSDDDDGRWIVDTDGQHITDRHGVTFWRYQFASTWIVSVLRNRAINDGRIGPNAVPVNLLAERLWETAANLHSLDPLFEDWLFNLAILAGNRDRVRFHDQRRSAVSTRNSLIARAMLYRSMAQPDPVLLDDQTSVVFQLIVVGAYSLAVDLGFKVLTDAQTVGTEFQTAMAGVPLGKALVITGDHGRAIPTLKTAVNELTKLDHAARPATTHQRELAVGLNELGVALREAGRASEAQEPLKESVNLKRELLKRDPTSPIHQHALAVGLNDLGVALRKAGRASKAQEPLNESVNLFRDLLKRDPTSPVHQRYLAIGLAQFGVALRKAGRASEAQKPLNESVNLHRELLKRDPTSPAHQRDLAVGLNDLGVALRKAGRASEAQKPLKESVNLHRELLKRDPTSPVHQLELAQAEQDLQA